MKEVPFQDSLVILREYDFKTDPEKLVVYLFDKMNSEDGLKALREGDKRFQDSQYFRKRLVAEFKGELIATTTVDQGINIYKEHSFRLYSVVTAPRFQGTGLSQILFEYVKDYIKKHNATLILVETWEDNIPARKFYEKLGFKEYGRLPNGLKNRNEEGFVDEIMYFMNI